MLTSTVLEGRRLKTLCLSIKDPLLRVTKSVQTLIRMMRATLVGRTVSVCGGFR